MEINSPIFVLTSDTDWASDDCIQDFAAAVRQFHIRPVFMATGKSAVLDRLVDENQIEVGIHPNFLPGSSHGANIESVIEHMAGLYPHATTFRSHAFVDSSHIAAALFARGFRYDSNLCLYMQRNIVPLHHNSGLVRYPVFWEDDVHWSRCNGEWNLDKMLADFLTPGLKILNVHPINFALNIPNAEAYQAAKRYIPTLTRDEMEKLRHRGTGTRTFVLDLLQRLRDMDVNFFTLSEVHEACSEKNEDDHGRADSLTENEHLRYWQVSAAERQTMIKDLYNKRNAADPYATSRDYNLRELEIDAIHCHLPAAGEIVDLGCGNGYTALCLARESPGRRIVAVDFAKNLIEGARELAAKQNGQTVPTFVHGDAISFLADQPEANLDGVVTERFLLNMPDRETQERIIADVFRVLRPGGVFAMCEGSADGFRSLNSVRKAVGLEEVLETSADNLSSIRFAESEIEAYCKHLGFQMESKLGFTFYFAMTRVLHPLLVTPLKPRFRARINDLARTVQMALPRTPGLGSNVLWVMRKTS